VFVELIEHLRCPAAHEPTALIGVASRAEHRHILDGTLGCPACGAEYPVRAGIARFGAAAPVPSAPAPSVEVATRIAAFLELTDARGFAVLTGRWCAHAEPLSRLVETPLVLVNPPEGASITGAAAVLEVGAGLPLAEGSARALAYDPDAIPAHAARVVRSAGRVLARASVKLPEGLREIARDDQDWVAERLGDAPPTLIELKRA
jgi:uncharacterized protein YbaR (Trm112 family)